MIPGGTVRFLRFLGAVCLLASAAPSFALEHVTLRSGFTYDCVRHESVGMGKVRVFFSDAANFIDLAADQIVSVEILPDPPPVSVMKPAELLPETSDVSVLLARAGAQHNIDVELLASLVKAESGGRAKAVSHAGAQGLMQLTPATALALGVADSFKPSENINGGTAYLDALLTRYKDRLDLALAAYNAGPRPVDKCHCVPPYRETRAYVVRVMTEFKRRKLASMTASNTH